MFDNIIGNEENKEIFEKTIKMGKFSHSYIFCGIEGIGKKIIAKEFAKKILCIENKEKDCKCKSCLEFNSNNNPDFQIIENIDGKIKIDQIRQMQRKIAEKPIISNSKVYIIDESDKMTAEAQNCLLKTLEEPPEYAIIILICANEGDLLNTIKSRCTRIKFKALEDNEIKKYIKKNMQEQQIDENIISLAQGSIGKAIKLMQKKDVYIDIEKIIFEMQKKDLIDIIQMSEIIYNTKEDIQSILECFNVILLKLSKQNTRYVSCISIVEETKKRLKANSNYDMCIDYMIFSIWQELRKI